MKYFSKTTKGFYDAEVNGLNLPDDAYEISEEYYVQLWAGQADGKHIAANEEGKPILVEPVLPTLTYAQNREREYPPITDYLDGVVKGDQAQIATYVASCLAVKEKFPKPGIDENLVG